MIHYPKGLFSIGLTSGLYSIAYSVLEVLPVPKVIEWEVMPGPRKKREVTHHRRYRAHRFMFEAIFSRWPPAVIGLGPPSSDEEPLEWVTFMRSGVFELGKAVGIPVVLFDSDGNLLRMLSEETGRSGLGLKTLIQAQMPEFTSNKRRVVLATATALAGAAHLRARQEMEISK